MGPWKFEEYQKACTNSSFFKNVREYFQSSADVGSEAVLQEKYFYAGASARWMFETSISDIEYDTNRFLTAVIACEKCTSAP